jgi:hypothetical protein
MPRTAALHHGRGKEVTERHRGRAVDRDAEQVLVEADVEEAPGRGDRGVVDEQPDLEAGDHVGHLPRHVRVGEVGGERPGLDAVRLLYRPGGLVEPGGTAGHHQHVQPAPRRLVGERGAYPGRSSGNAGPGAVLLSELAGHQLTGHPNDIPPLSIAPASRRMLRPVM